MRKWSELKFGVYLNFRIIVRDSLLLDLWHKSRLWPKFGWWIDKEVMARQILNADVALKFARQERVCDWSAVLICRSSGCCTLMQMNYFTCGMQIMFVNIFSNCIIRYLFILSISLTGIRQCSLFELWRRSGEAWKFQLFQIDYNV